MESTILGAENLDLETAPNPICCGDSGGRAGCVTKPYKNYTVQILESELVLTHFCKAEANEIDFDQVIINIIIGLTVCDGVSVCASAIVPDIRCLGYRNLTLETSSPSSQSSAVASPGPAKCCARSTSPLCHAVI